MCIRDRVRRVSHIEAVDLAAVQCRRLLETVAGKSQIHVVVRLVHGIVHEMCIRDRSITEEDANRMLITASAPMASASLIIRIVAM